jgi:hypothetical protein
VCKKSGVRTTLYPKFPLTLDALLHTRKLYDTTEIEILGLFPVVRTLGKRNKYMREDFLKDMESL